MVYVFAAMVVIFILVLLIGSILAIIYFIKDREYALALVGISLWCGFIGVIGLACIC